MHVDWPSLAISVPTRIETFTLDVAVSVSFTNNVCSPVSVRGNNNNQRVLRGVRLLFQIIITMIIF